MSFSDILNQLVSKKKIKDARSQKDTGLKQKTHIATERQSTAPSAPAPVEKAEPDNLDNAIELFESIQEIIDDDGEKIKIPAEALLKNLPEHLRGPQFDADNIPEEFHLILEAQPLLEKLQGGSVVYPLKLIPTNLPDGWVADDADEEVSLDLAIVYNAIPPELIEISSRITEAMEEIIEMPDYFKPGTPTPATSESDESETDEDEQGTVADQTPPPWETTEQDAAEVVAEDSIEAGTFDQADDKPSSEPTTIQPVEEEEPKAEPVPSIATEPDHTGSDEIPAAADENEDIAEAASESGEEELPAARSIPEQKNVLRPAKHVSRFEGTWDGRERLNAAVSPTDINEASLNELMGIPGVGRKRAEAIMHYRSLHGAIESIYDLLSIPGVGEKNFYDMTGLDPADRKNRSIVINQILDLTETRTPRLTEITDAAVKALNADGCILAGKDGIIISQSHSMSADSARQYAALAPKIFRGTKKYIPRLSGEHPNMFALPGSTPPLLFAGLEHLFLILALKDDGGFKAITDKAAELANELDWFFSNRAVVSKK